MRIAGFQTQAGLGPPVEVLATISLLLEVRLTGAEQGLTMRPEILSRSRESHKRKGRDPEASPFRTGRNTRVVSPARRLGGDRRRRGALVSFPAEDPGARIA